MLDGNLAQDEEEAAEAGGGDSAAGFSRHCTMTNIICDHVLTCSNGTHLLHEALQ